MASNEGDLDATPESFANSGETYGHLNQHPKAGVKTNYRVGVSVDRNRACRRTMEDAHSFIYDFAGLKGQGYFAIFDGHAGVKAAEYCGLHFHEHLLANLAKTPDTPIPHLLNATFHSVDTAISELSARENSHSGCTAVACLLRLEDEHGNPVGEGSGVGSGVATVRGELDGKAGEAAEKAREKGIDPTEGKPGSNGGSPASFGAIPSSAPSSTLANPPANDGSGLKDKLKSVLSSKFAGSPSSSGAASPAYGTGSGSPGQVTGPAQEVKAAKKTLYTANAGDARAVLARGGQAIRLSYDHKGTDPKEIKRIEAAGGYVSGQRVNGYLAVTRALGDSQMKQFVVGAPYTTETTIRPEDEFLIIACDGLWDVCSDQQAVDLIAGEVDPQQAADKLLQYALGHRSTDNLSIMVIALNPQA